MARKRNSSPEAAGTQADAQPAPAQPDHSQKAVRQDVPGGPAHPAHCPPVAGIGASAGGQDALEKLFAATLDEELQDIFAIIKAATGHDFSDYKRNTLLRRIERRMAVNEIGGLGKYITLLRGNPQEAYALSQDILIGVTNFFRDPDAFATLRREVIPRLFEGRDPDDPVRIWHACCATGEEVYSMAILVRDYLDRQRINARVQFFATDIDEAAVAQARAGLYTDEIEADLDEELLRSYFTRYDGRWQVAKHLREMIVFAHHSLIKDPPFSRLDLLVCRNFLIYLNPDMQKRLIPLFYQVLKPGGILFLGSAESVGRHSDLFSPVDKKWRIFQRLEGGRRPDSLFPIAASVRRYPGRGTPARQASPAETGPAAIAEKLLLERYAPPCVIINDKCEVVHFTSRTSLFLEPPIGGPTRDILKLAREELRPPLRAAIHKAFSEKGQVSFRGVKIAIDGEMATANVIVEPLTLPPPAENLAMVTIEPVLSAASIPPGAGDTEKHSSVETSGDQLTRSLEEQLRSAQEQLKATTEQLETAHEGFMSSNEELMSINEEYQSTNEELHATNEELETSKEELQALNEELVTVNAELHGKVEELDQANSDMENLLDSTRIATIFLDHSLRIKRFTPAVAEIFNLLPTDFGRPFLHLAGKIDWPTFAHDAETVLAGQPFAEREVTTLDRERCYLKRLFPYRTEGRIAGIVVTFIDITERKQLEAQTVHLASFPQLNPNPVLEVDADCRVIFSNPATKLVLENLGMDEMGVDVFLPPDLGDILRSWDKTGDATLYREIVLGELVFGESLFLTPRFDVARIYAFDITAQKQAEEANARLAAIVESSDDAIIAKELNGTISSWNFGAERMLGYPAPEVIGKPITLLIPAELHSEEEQILQRLLAGERVDHYETVRLASDGRRIDVSVTVSPIRNGEGQIIGASKIIRDITEHKKAEEALRESDERVRRKLESIISPEGDLSSLDLADIIDARSLQSLVDDFYELTGMPMGLIDLTGNVLVGVGWQDICTKFHRIHPETCKNCIESDTLLSAGVPPGEYKVYKCKNNLWDVATPVMVGNRHFGNLFMGQFFFEDEPIDYELFRSQARQYGFDEKEYITALEAVPRLSRETLNTSMSFFIKLAGLLSLLSYSNLNLARSLAERDALMESLRETEEQFRTLVDSIPNLAWWANGDGYITWYNRRWYEYTGTTPEQMEGWGWQSIHDPDVLPKVMEKWQASIATGQPFEMEFPLRGADGIFRTFLTRVLPMKDSAGLVFRWFGTNTDISALKQAEKEIRRHVKELHVINDELTRFNEASVGRELRMIALKREINDLCSRSGQPPRYPLEFEEKEG